jgi:DNA-binding SARP family transcriptional activator
MKIQKKINILLLSFFVTSLAYGQYPKAGLYFYSHDHNIDKRTALILNNNEAYSLNAHDNFKLDFSVFLRNEEVKFGYIFRIISNTEENFDFIINNQLNAFLVVNNRDFQLKSSFPLEQWNHLSILFQKELNQISLFFNDEKITCPYDLQKIQSLTVNFGQCDFKNFLTTDVAPIILKEVHVYYNGKEQHRWPLGQHGVNRVNDELKNKPAIVHNPYWLMDNRIYWKKSVEFQSGVFPQIAFDSIHDIIYLQNEDELIRYSLRTHSEERIKTSPEVRYQYYNCLLFDPVSSNLLFYNIENNQCFFFNFEKQTWINYQNTEEKPTHAHHNRYISGRDSMLYLFGGYGFYKYNSDFFKVNPKSNEYLRHDFSSTITPRYLAAMGGNTNGDKVYILGGRGAEMGRQELSPSNFSDLFEVDLETMNVKYLFDIDKESDSGNLYSNSLVLDNENKNIYVLAYPNKKYTSPVHLKKINLETQKVETLADSLEFYFQDITSFCDLYYSSHLSQLIALTSYSNDQLSSVVRIYTLDYPPLKESDVIQNGLSFSNKRSFLFIIVAVFILLASLFLLGIKKLKFYFISKKDLENLLETEDEEKIPKEKLYYNVKKKSIVFLGGFQVFNKEGKNITGEFTPTLKYLLVLITLYTLKNNKGISSSKLQELLWYDKTEDAARNNRNVNLRKLRLLLLELGAIDIEKQNSYWMIYIPEDVLSDYKESLRLINTIQNETVTSIEDLLRLIELLNYGTILPNIQLEWVDSFKTDFSNQAIDTLMHAINNNKNPFYKQQDIRLKVADALLKIDSINEEAIRVKCNALIKMGKMGLAKTTFENFNKEYKMFLGEHYPGDIKKFLN